MKKDNSFIKECILQALLQLMDEKDFKDISITEITKKAGVSRMAYYRNYYYKEDIFNNYMTELLEKYQNVRNEIVAAHPNDKYQMMFHVFEYFKVNEKLGGISQWRLRKIFATLRSLPTLTTARPPLWTKC